jgi:hypothetical protein
MAPHLVVDGEWGPREIARHLVTVERVVWQARLDQLAADERPRWAYAEPGVGPADHRPLDEIVAAFTTERAATLGRLAALDEAGWSRSGIHATFGVLDVEGVCRVMADHDEEHLPVP